MTRRFSTLSGGERMNMTVDVKTIGSSGQISLGKKHAGRTVTVEEIEPGVWLIKAARLIPEREMWLQDPRAGDALERRVRPGATAG